MASAFAYSPLDPKREEIRVLILSPGPCDEDDVMECTLHHISLAATMAPLNVAQTTSSKRRKTSDSSRMEYETISYVWGHSGLPSTIRLDGHIVNIPRSSEKALRRVRLPRDVRVLWIDAICINQEDNLDEKSQQVALMSKIYRHGKRNLVYLGEDDRYVESALQSVRLLLDQEVAEFIGPGRSLIDSLYDENGGWLFSEVDFAVDFDQDALAWLFSRSWFKRLWVVQEATCSPSNLCYCGRSEFELFDVLLAALWLWHKHLHLSSRLQSTKGLECAFRTFGFIKSEHSIYGCGRFAPPLAVLLDSARKLECSDHRDRVYGVLGLVEWSIRGGIPKLLLPDYKAPLSLVLARATYCAIMEEKSLDAFLFVSHRSKLDIHHGNLPSWVPRWQRVWDTNLDATAFSDLFEASIGMPFSCTFDEPVSEFERHSRCRIQGFVLDQVKRVHRSGTRWTWSGFRRNYILALRSFLAQTEDSHMIEAWVLSAGAWAGIGLTSDRAEVCKRLISNILSGGDLPPNPHELPTDAGTNEKELAHCRWAFYDACHHRRICTTARHLPCLVPKITEVGDVLAILFGASTPYVLRPCGDVYEIIGQAYVYGMMHGEAVNEWQEKKEPATNFTLI